MIPKKKDQAANRKKKGSGGGRPVSHDAALYKERSTDERLINKLKAWRGIATRYIVIARLRWDTRTRSYVERRVTEGKTRREAIRCLKRYVAREIYQALLTSIKQPPAPVPAG